MKTFTGVNKLLLRLVCFFALSTSAWAADYTLTFAGQGTQQEPVSSTDPNASMSFTVDVFPCPIGNDKVYVDFSLNEIAGQADADVDYKDSSGTLTFDKKTCQVNFFVDIAGDNISEGEETFQALLSNPSTNGSETAAIAGTNPVLGRIQDNEGAVLPFFTIVPTAPFILEPDSNETVDYNFTVTLSEPLGSAFHVDYTTVNGSALSPDDYTATSGQLIFPVGETVKTISVTIIGDDDVEFNEDFSVMLSNWDANVTPAIRVAAGVITNNDGNETGNCSIYRNKIIMTEYHYMITYKDFFNDGNPVQYGNFIELKLQDGFEGVDDNWTIELYDGQGLVGNMPFEFAKRDAACGFPYIIFDYEDLSQYVNGGINIPGPNQGSTVIVKDQWGKEIEFFELNGGHQASACATELGVSPYEAFGHDINITMPANSQKDIYRAPENVDGNYTSEGEGANSGASRCIDLGGGISGVFDVVDRNVAPSLGVIRTKIVNNPADYSILSINSALTGLADLNNSVKVRVYMLPVGNNINAFDLDLGEHILPAGTSQFDVLNGIFFDAARPEQHFAVRFCRNDVNLSNVYDYDQCNAVTNASHVKWAFSLDDFAIRPNNFTLEFPPGTTIPNNTSFTAGVLANMAFRAPDIANVDSPAYNDNQDSSFEVNIDISDVTQVCPEPEITINPLVDFTDGLDQRDFRFDNVGVFNLVVEEIPGAEFAVVDADDTLDPQRYITPFTVSNIRIIPDHFRIDYNLTDANNANNFTYLHNFNASGDYTGMSAGLSALFSARTAIATGDAVTSNYIDTCAAQPTTLTLEMGATDITPSDNRLTQFLYYNNIENTEGNTTLPSPQVNITSLPINNLAASFTAGAAGGPGTASINYSLNFNRRADRPVNPFTISLTDIDITDTDGVSDIDGTTDIPTSALDKDAVFYYGRVHAPRYRVRCDDVGTIECNNRTVNMYYEVFSSTSTNLLLPNVAPNTLLSVDDIQWYRNESHDATVTGTDGNVTAFAPRNGALAGDLSLLAPTPATVTPFSFGTFSYTGTKGYPYKTTIDITTNNWLLHHRFDPNPAVNRFELEFNSGSEWVGQNPGTISVDTDASRNTTRRIEW